MKLLMSVSFHSRYGPLVWGGVDGLWILGYCTLSVSNNHFPYLYEYQFLEMFWRHSYSLRDWQFIVVAVGAPLFVLNVSMFLSCILFLLRAQCVRYVVIVQLPLRLVMLLVLGSLVLANWPEVKSVRLGALAFLFVLIESARVFSIKSTIQGSRCIE